MIKMKKDLVMYFTILKMILLSCDLTLSLKESCWPAESQRNAGILVSRSIRHSDVKSVPVISSS